MSRLTLIDMFKNESAETFNKCSKAYELGRADEKKTIMEKLKNVSGHYWGIDGEIYLNATDVLEIFDKEQKDD